MDREISQGLRLTFLIHFFAGAIFGLTYLLVPELYGELFNWPIKDPVLYRLLGAAILGYGISSYLAYKDPRWQAVRIIVLMEIIWTGLGTAVMVYGMTMTGLPAIGWMNTVILGLFALAFTYFYMKEKE